VADTYSQIERRLASEQQVFARPLRTLVQREPITCDEGRAVADVVRTMRAERVGSVVVVDGAGRPVGIFTERDLIRAVAEGRVDAPVAELMTRDPLALAPHAPAYEAALLMVARRVRHLLVAEPGRLLGVVSERDLFSLQRLGIGELTMEIRMAKEVDVLADLAGQIGRLARLMVEQGVPAEPLTLFVSVLNDRLTERVIELARKQFAWDGLSWCWLAFGSEGRLEQTFATDQDNGLAFVVHDGTAAPSVREKLLPFARRVNDALDACGFPLCKGNVMASNPELCLSVEEWKAKIAGWTENTDPKALLDASICFDFRAIAGDAGLAQELREFLLGRTRARPVFLRLMTQNALEARPALGLLRDFATEDVPNAPHTVNLKLRGARPFVDAARIYALARGLPQTNTSDRLRAAGEAGALGIAETQSQIAAFSFIQSLRLRAQAIPVGVTGNAAADVANRVDPGRLNALERRTLKEAFRIARELQERLALDYRL
jgi:CBS domain-containing protein